jgi:hypothetical protein
MTSRSNVLVVLLCAAASGCSSGHTPEAQVNADATASGQAESGDYSCDDADSVELGTSVEGAMGRISAKLLDATPWPAQTRSPANAWTVQLLTASGDPAFDAAVSSVKVLDHIHNIFRMPEDTTELDDKATFQLDVSFLLRSLWIVELHVVTPSGDDVLELPVCVVR